MNKGMLPNFNLLDGNSIVWTIDLWTNFSTHQSVFYIEKAQLDNLNHLTDQINLNKNCLGFVMLKIINLNDQALLNLMIEPYSLNSVK